MDEPGDDPVWWCAYVTGISAATGWLEDFILWELPYARGLGYVHAIAVSHGQEMELVAGRDWVEDEGRGGMRDGFETMRERWAGGGEDAVGG